jgi:hypothetical protein
LSIGLPFFQPALKLRIATWAAGNSLEKNEERWGALRLRSVSLFAREKGKERAKREERRKRLEVIEEKEF